MDTEHSDDSRANKAMSFVKLPSMYSPNSKASDPDQDASGSHATNASVIDFDQLPVSNEIKDLFHVIDEYEPVELDLDTPLKCFMPSYIPSVGDVYAGINIPRPDGVDDGIGTAILDEIIPGSQSNAAVIELQLRNLSKTMSSRAGTVRSISNAAENKKDIDQWIDSVEEIHATSLPTEVRYHNKMPSVQELVQAWPKDIQDELRNGSLELPGAEVDLSVEEYARMLCSLLGIPVYEGRLIESLHVAFSLFIELHDSNIDNAFA